jgi:hypothetical protein
VTLPPPAAGSPRPRAQPHSRMPDQAPAAVRLAASDLSDNGDVIPEPLGRAPDQLDIAKSDGRSLYAACYSGRSNERLRSYRFTWRTECCYRAQQIDDRSE